MENSIDIRKKIFGDRFKEVAPCEPYRPWATVVAMVRPHIRAALERAHRINRQTSPIDFRKQFHVSLWGRTSLPPSTTSKN